MSTREYQELLNYIADRIQALTHEEQVQLLHDLPKIINKQHKTHNVMEFQGVAGDFWKNLDLPRRKRILEYEGIGQETWKDTSVQDYINQERDSWDV